MANFLISFDDQAMRGLTREEITAASLESRDVVRDAKAAGVWRFGGGVDYARDTSVVTPDGHVSHAPDDREPSRRIAGVTIVSVEDRAEALAWAARIAAACRCPQQVREFMFDPES